MVTGDFIGYFAAAGTAAGTLIGLLFVAVSLRPDSVLGAGAPPAAQAVAGSAFIALVNSFFVSLVAVIPHTSLGYVAAVMAVASLWYTLRLHRGPAGSQTAWRQLLSVVADLLVSSFAVGLVRAWSLMKGDFAQAKQEQPSAQ